MLKRETSFLVDCLKYNVGANTEDRLTAIVTSSFNHSEAFKKAFCKFLKIEIGRDLIAFQQHAGHKSRVDLILKTKKGDIRALIESKTESKIDLRQLKSHSTISAEKRYFISKYIISSAIMPKGWISLQWRDLSEVLAHNKGDFICREVLIYLKENNMIPPDQISVKDIEKCSKFLNSIRYQATPEISDLLANLESVNKIAAMLQVAAQEIIIDTKKFSGKRPKAKITYFYDDQPTLKSLSRKKSKNPEDLYKMHKHANIGLAIYIEMKDSKPFLGLRLNTAPGIFSGNVQKTKPSGEIIAGAFKKNWTYTDEVVIKFRKSELSLDNLKDQVRNAWS